MLNLKLKNKKGNSSIEYAFLIAVVIGALIGMQAYLKRPVCQRWRLAGDAFGFGRQYAMVEPPPPPPDPPVTGIHLTRVFIFKMGTNEEILRDVNISLTPQQVESYYTSLVTNNRLTLTVMEFGFLFHVGVEEGQYDIYWMDGTKPHYGLLTVNEG